MSSATAAMNWRFDCTSASSVTSTASSSGALEEGAAQPIASIAAERRIDARTLLVDARNSFVGARTLFVEWKKASFIMRPRQATRVPHDVPLAYDARSGASVTSPSHAWNASSRFAIRTTPVKRRARRELV